MKIGITGAQGTGKTTLAKALSEKLNIRLITEQARQAAKDLGLESLRELKGNPELGRKFQWMCLKLQWIEERSTKDFVADRTVLDNAVYWQKWHSHNAESGENMDYYEMVERGFKHYDFIIYCPVEFELVDDGFRSTNKYYQLEIDFIISLWLRYLNPEKLIIVSGDVDTRVREVLDLLTYWGEVNR